jgi:hypothetical protein
MVEWQDFVAGSATAPRDMYGPQWKTTPCIAVTSTGITFNEAAIKFFRLAPEMKIRAMFSPDGNMIGFRVLERTDDTVGALNLKQNRDNGGKKRGSTLTTGTNAFAKRLERFRGHVCELTIETNSRVVVAMLDSPIHVWKSPKAERPAV